MGLLNEQSMVGSGSITNGSKPSEYKPLKLVSKKYPHLERGEERPAAAAREATLFHTIEQLAALEATLHFIVEGVRAKATDIAFFCREYWGSSASMAQLSLDELSWGDPLAGHVRRACALESLSMAVLSRLSSGTMQDVSMPMRLKLRKLTHHLHENCLVLLDLVRQRWDREGRERGGGSERLHCPNSIDFKILEEAGRYQSPALRDGDHGPALAKNSEAIAGLLTQTCEGGPAQQPPRGETGDVLRAVRDRLADDTPLERLATKAVRSDMLALLCFQALSGGGAADSAGSWPPRDPYERSGKGRFAEGGAAVLFEPHAPVIADLDSDAFLPRRSSASSSTFYTLVLDLDETLVHTPANSKSFRVRPGATQFLQKMSSLGYELVIFTTATQDYADSIIDQIDPRKTIKFRLYRQHTLPWGPLHIKDLSRLGRDLGRTLIIDNIAENFLLQPQNGILIRDWLEDQQDKCLYNLTPVLEELINTCAQVPDILGRYADQIPVWAGVREAPQGGLPAFTPQSRAVQQPVVQPAQEATAQQPVSFAVTYAPVVMQVQPWSFVDASSTTSAPVAAVAQVVAPGAGPQASFQAPVQAVAQMVPVTAAPAAEDASSNFDKGAAKARRTIKNARFSPPEQPKPVSSC